MPENVVCATCQTENAPGSSFCRGCGTRLDEIALDAGGMHWRWVAYGVAIMLGATLMGGFVLGLVLVAAGTPLETLRAGRQLPFMVPVALLSFGAGGFLVGLRSPGKTILEPGLAAALAVALSLVIQGNYDPIGLIFGGGLPFLAGVAGGYLGEKVQGTI